MSGAPSCFETPRHNAWKPRVNALTARLLSMRAGECGAAGEAKSIGRDDDVAVSASRPHPEEARSAVSKDGRRPALMLRDAAP